MIGYRKYDLIEARNKGITSIGVGYGYGSVEELTGEKSAYYCVTFQDVAPGRHRQTHDRDCIGADARLRPLRL
jgi:hypothetical protein